MFDKHPQKCHILICTLIGMKGNKMAACCACISKRNTLAFPCLIDTSLWVHRVLQSFTLTFILEDIKCRPVRCVGINFAAAFERTG